MRLTLIVTIIILITINSVSALTINEINYNPQGPDNNKEYVELFSSTFLNLTNYTIEDLSSSDILTLVKTSSSNFYLIVEDGFDYSLIDANVYTAGAAIGNGLHNSNDEIKIRDPNGLIMDSFNYSSSMGANDNGKSLCRFPHEIGIFNEYQYIVYSFWHYSPTHIGKFPFWVTRPFRIHVAPIISSNRGVAVFD